MVVLYFPASHAKHVPPSGPVNPILQTQFVGDVDAAEECVSEGHATQALSDTAPVVPRYLPAPQTVHVEEVEAPVAAEYLPAPQSVHVVAPVAAEYLPAAQTVHVADIEAPVAVEYVPAPQSRHVAEVEARVAVEYLPVPQSVHTAEPMVVEYLPASQFAQKLLFNVDFTRIITIPEPPFPPQHMVQL